MAVLLSLSSWCFVTVSIRWLFLAVPWVGLQSVIVAFPEQTHLLFLVKKHFCDVLLCLHLSDMIIAD